MTEYYTTEMLEVDAATTEFDATVDIQQYTEESFQDLLALSDSLEALSPETKLSPQSLEFISLGLENTAVTDMVPAKVHDDVTDAKEKFEGKDADSLGSKIKGYLLKLWEAIKRVLERLRREIEKFFDTVSLLVPRLIVRYSKLAKRLDKLNKSRTDYKEVEIEAPKANQLTTYGKLDLKDILAGASNTAEFYEFLSRDYVHFCSDWYAKTLVELLDKPDIDPETLNAYAAKGRRNFMKMMGNLQGSGRLLGDYLFDHQVPGKNEDTSDNPDTVGFSASFYKDPKYEKGVRGDKMIRCPTVQEMIELLNPTHHILANYIDRWRQAAAISITTDKFSVRLNKELKKAGEGVFSRAGSGIRYRFMLAGLNAQIKEPMYQANRYCLKVAIALMALVEKSIQAQENAQEG